MFYGGNINFFDNVKGKFSSSNQALQIQKEIINSLQEGNPLHDVIKDNKEIIVKWYKEGKQGKELYSNFYNQLNHLARDDLIFEDLSSVVENVKESNQFFTNRDDLILFNSPNDIDKWYIKGRDGDVVFDWFYHSIKQYAFEDVIKHDEKLLLGLLNDGVDLKAALNSPKIFSTKKEFKENSYGKLDSIIEKYSKESIVEGLGNGKLFIDLIKDEDIYNTSEEIIGWYEQGRIGNSQHVDFYKQALPFVVKQDYLSISDAIKEGVPADELLSLPSIMSSNEEFKEYLPFKEDASLEGFLEQDTQKAILNSCKSGISFRDAISDYVLNFKSNDIEIWYKLGRGGDSKYEDFYNKLSPYVLKDDLEVILKAVESGKSLKDAIDESDLISPKDFIKHLYAKNEFETVEIASVINRTIDTLISNTNFSFMDFDFDAKNKDVEQWIELGKLNIKPFKEFYDDHLIYKTQARVVESLKNNELMENAISHSDLAYKPEEIISWFFMGKKGERFTEFYNECLDYAIDETKEGIIDYLELYPSFSEAIEKYDSLFTEEEIRDWFNKGKIGENHVEFYERCVEIMHQFRDSIGSLEELFTFKYEEKLLNSILTSEEYDKIIDEIYNMGKPLVKFNEDDCIFEKISKIVNVYAPWSYKSRGSDLGSYKSNFIKLDERLVDSQKIATLIHELTHHLVAEILEIALCYMLDVEKTQAIEGFVAYFLTDPLTKIMNEYCASTVEGRFVPHGFQNYGTFEMFWDDCELDESLKSRYIVIGNTFANDIINILEKFIDFDLREEIKKQFIKDGFDPRYEGIIFESEETIPKELAINYLSNSIIDYYNLAKESDSHKEILDISYRSFDSSYQ